jgi:pimeloyl-ACP methyl ester carboxylesterase
MNDIAIQAKQLLYHKGSPTRRAVARVCPLLANGEHQMVGEGDEAIAAWRLDGEAFHKPAVLLVHGWEDDTSLWTPLVHALYEGGRNVIGFDLPGHGYSDGEACNVDLAADAIARVIARLGPVDSIAGHSFGGVAIAGALVAGLDVGNVVLISPPTFQTGQYERQWRRHGVSEDLIAAALELGRETNHFFDLVKVARGFTADALFVHSLDDPQCPAEDARQAAQAWPNAKFWPVDGLGHRALVKDDEVVSLVASWLLG